MKILFIDESGLRNIKEKLNINEFLKENKMVIISQYPYFSFLEEMAQLLKKEKIYGNDLDSIMYIANGELACFFIRGNDKQNIKYICSNNVSLDEIYPVIANHGPSLLEEDLFYFPINYYYEKYGCDELKILFYSQNYFRKRYDFNVNKLWNTYKILIGKNELSNDEIHFNNIELEIKLDTENRQKPKKIIFCDAEGIFYSHDSDIYIDGIKYSLEQYLNQGNFLALFCETGNHYGELFTIDKYPIHDSIENKNMHTYIISYFKSLSLDPNQVYSFKTGRVGFNFNGESCNLGFSCMSYSTRKKLSILYLQYLKKLGYNIDQVNFLTYPIGAWFKIGWEKQQEDLIIMAQQNNGIYHMLKDQEDFNNVVLNKILKK